MAPVSRSTPCSALWAKCVRPSFIFVIFASGSWGDRQSLFDVFLPFRDRSKRANSTRVGVAIPEASANRRTNASYDSPVSRRSMLRIAALASSVVASTPTVFPRTRPAADSRSRTHVKTAMCVSTSISRRVRDSGRVIRRCLGHIQVQEEPKAQRIGHPPRNPTLRRQTLEIPDEQHPEIPPRTQARPPHPRRVEHRAQSLDEGVKPGVIQDPV